MLIGNSTTAAPPRNSADAGVTQKIANANDAPDDQGRHFITIHATGNASNTSRQPAFKASPEIRSLRQK